MAITGQTITERLAADGVSAATGANHIAFDGGVVELSTLFETLLTEKGVHRSGLVVALSDVVPAIIARSIDNSPASNVFEVQRLDEDVYVAAGNNWDSTVIGIVSAINVFDAHLWITSDQTEPPLASNGQYWLHPRPA